MTNLTHDDALDYIGRITALLNTMLNNELGTYDQLVQEVIDFEDEKLAIFTKLLVETLLGYLVYVARAFKISPQYLIQDLPQMVNKNYLEGKGLSI